MHKYDNQLEDFFGLSAGSSEGHVKESIKDAIARKLSLRTRLRLLPKVLSRNERYIVLGLLTIAIGAVALLPLTTYFHYTTPVPADGGSFREGILGEPHLVNPLLSQTNDADRDLTSLVYSGLLRYNGKGKLIPDLAKSLPEITSDGLSYSVTIRDDAKWQDGVPVTADDILFTIELAQNPDYGVPTPVRAAWQSVQVTRASDTVVIFHLKNKYAQFSNNMTLGILPKHLWQDVKPINFGLSELNIKPIGSGPYRFKSLIKNNLGHIQSYKLAAWDQYYEGRPHIDGIEFKFYGSEDELIEAFNKNDIDTLSYISGQNVSRLHFRGRIDIAQLKMPRYFALFFNQNQSKALSDKNVRLALNEGTDRVQIINKTLDGNAFLINSPMMGGILDINPNVTSYDFDLDQAKSVLKAGGWTADSEGVLTHGKDNRLEIKITTSTWPELATVAQTVKEQWEKLGAKVTVETLPISQLQQVIKERNYQILLFGEILSVDPDPYTLWHSSQRQEPGLNLALYSNKTADKLLEEARATLNPLERMQKYDDFQKILIEDMPAVFLYSPHYLYGISNDIRGFDTNLIAVPSDRFDNIRNWYIDTSRKFK
jgi:peptide/nickel transport system substrate-binding protein